MKIFDFILKTKGFNIKKAVQKIDNLHNMSTDEFYDWVEIKKWKIAKFHYLNNPQYKSLVGNSFPDNWSDLPIIEKKYFQTDIERILSTGYTTNNTYIASTTGSTGKPLWFAKNKFAHAMTWAMLKNRYRVNGINISKRQGRFWQIPKSLKLYYTEKLKDIIMNRSRFTVEELNDSTFSKILKRMKKDKISYIYGYTNTIVAFAKYLKKNKIILSNICPEIRNCIVTAEMLHSDDKKLISENLGVRVINEYGISEIGLAGFDTLDDDLVLSEETIFYEILYMKNFTNLDDGVGNLILTDLFNKAFPMIRYKVGDLGKIKSTESNDLFRKKFEKLYGRENDIIRLSNGRQLPGFSLIKPFDYFFEEKYEVNLGKVREFIFRQHNLDEFTLDIVSDYDINVYEENEIKNLFKTILKLDINLKINKVNSIESMRNGKMKQFYSLIDE